jgi:hypothetical protein
MTISSSERFERGILMTFPVTAVGAMAVAKRAAARHVAVIVFMFIKRKG